jgi:hypothetical protein
VRNQELTVGKGKNAVRVDRYLSDAQIYSLDRACMSKNATRRESRRVTLRLLRSLPPDVERKVRALAVVA